MPDPPSAADTPSASDYQFYQSTSGSSVPPLRGPPPSGPLPAIPGQQYENRQGRTEVRVEQQRSQSGSARRYNEMSQEEIEERVAASASAMQIGLQQTQLQLAPEYEARNKARKAQEERERQLQAAADSAGMTLSDHLFYQEHTDSPGSVYRYGDEVIRRWYLTPNDIGEPGRVQYFGPTPHRPSPEETKSEGELNLLCCCR